ncbi:MULTISPECIES: hypothetical protein [Kamptonema]|nr:MULTISPECIES: hypothetical protein [Kamptonema]CBN58103.1 hypothetical protein OSCI_3620026 [Kamptonema sp. PCC 6506]
MSQIRLYLDEDSRSKKLLQALESRGVDIYHYSGGNRDVISQ